MNSIVSNHGNFKGLKIYVGMQVLEAHRRNSETFGFRRTVTDIRSIALDGMEKVVVCVDTALRVYDDIETFSNKYTPFID